MTLTRRDLIKSGALAGAGLAFSSSFVELLSGSPVSAAPAGGYGALIPDPNGLIDLPPGFSYRVLGRGGVGWPTGYDTYDDGQKLAGDADGAASFRGRSNSTLLTFNHELGGGEGDPGVPKTFHGRPVATYNPAVVGGCSTIVVDKHGEVVSRYPVIAGTHNNCAGGLTPWGTWLTCEETTATIGGINHGYVFEVDPTGKLTTGEPILGMGRYAHEAVCIDPRSGMAYLTEDAGQTGLVYRYEPNDRAHRFGALGQGGTLTAMRIEGFDAASEITQVGSTHPVTWTPVPAGVDPTTTTSLNAAFDNSTVTRSRKWEGAWFGNGKAYFAVSYQEATLGRTPNNGQVFAYDPKAGTIELVMYIPGAEADLGPTDLESPDNITIAPDGSLWLAEDGNVADQYIYALGADGVIFPFAHNATADDNEFAGINFSPDGRTLFVSIQSPSTTFAITGPFGMR